MITSFGSSQYFSFLEKFIDPGILQILAMFLFALSIANSFSFIFLSKSSIIYEYQADHNAISGDMVSPI
jgi:hypothetical protein